MNERSLRARATATVGTLTACSLAVGAGLAAAPIAAHAAGSSTAVTLAGLNVRSGPSLSAPIIGGLKSGSTVQVQTIRGEWATITYYGRTAYVAAQYLTTSPAATPKPTPAPVPAAAPGAATRVTSANLNARVGAGVGYRILRVIPAGTTVQVTGVVRKGYAEIRLGSQPAWVLALYLNKGKAPAKAATPKPTRVTAPVTGMPTTTTAWTTATLNVRSKPTQASAAVGMLPQGARVATTGVVQGAWTQILHEGVRRWVASQWLTSAKKQPPLVTSTPTGGLPNTSSTARTAYTHLRAQFPEVRTVYGFRHGTGSDHNVGKALDFMIAGYADDSSVGDRLAAYVQAHAEELDVKYIIWEQRIWYAARPERGWRLMGDRGGDTANHFDHVHVSFNH